MVLFVCLFFWILSVFLYRSHIYNVRIPVSNETNALLFSISETSQNYQRGKPKGGPCHCISALTVHLHFNASNIRLKDTLIPGLVITEEPPYSVQLQYNYQGFITE